MRYKGKHVYLLSTISGLFFRVRHVVPFSLFDDSIDEERSFIGLKSVECVERDSPGSCPRAGQSSGLTFLWRIRLDSGRL